VTKRLKPAALARDLKQAFLKVCIQFKHRDALKFHWIKDKESQTYKINLCNSYRDQERPWWRFSEEQLLRKTVRVTTWIKLFLNNCRQNESARLVGPLTTSETDLQVQWWIQRAHGSSNGTGKFNEDSTCKRTARGCAYHLVKFYSRESGSWCAHHDVSWRSWSHNSAHQTWLLDPSTETVN